MEVCCRGGGVGERCKTHTVLLNLICFSHASARTPHFHTLSIQIWRANAAPNLFCVETLVSVNRFSLFSVWCHLESYADNSVQKFIVKKSEKGSENGD